MRYIFSFFMGIAIGSFANVCILRLPREESLWFPQSHCPRCKRSLKALENIPLISFLALRGRCAGCRAPISWQYPFIESLMGILFVMQAWLFRDTARLLVIDALSFYLVTISIIDYRHRIIPDELSLSLFAAGLFYSFINPYLPGPPGIKFLHSFTASLGGGLLMWGLAYSGEKIFKKEALGGGDIKLIAAAGAAMGWSGVAGSLFIGSLSGGFAALGLILLKKKKFGETLPFGPFLSLGIYFSCFFPQWWTFLFRP